MHVSFFPMRRAIFFTSITSQLQTINEETGNPVMKEAIDALKEHVEETKVMDENELDRQLGILTSELSKSVPHRVQASKTNVQEYLLKIMAYELKRSDHLKDSVSRSNWTLNACNLFPFSDSP